MMSWPGYAPTALLRLEPLAARLGLRSLLYKDESTRFGLQSFKAMGAAYALACEVDRALGLTGEPLFDCTARAIRRDGAPFAVACASDGNHGRAVAWTAAKLGLRCRVFLHERVSAARERAITALGASVERVAGNYDDSVHEAASQAAANGWRIISDTAYEGYETVPADVMQGYAAIAAEIRGVLPRAMLPTHVIVQAGVGGLAAAMFSYFAGVRPSRPTVNICVEPLAAACLFASACRGERTLVTGDLDTIMAGLSCGEPSTLAWERIVQFDTHFMAISDAAAATAMRVLADPRVCGQRLIAGESGAAGLAALLVLCGDPALRDSTGLDEHARVLLIGTEGATDPESYARILSERDPIAASLLNPFLGG